MNQRACHRTSSNRQDILLGVGWLRRTLPCPLRANGCSEFPPVSGYNVFYRHRLPPSLGSGKQIHCGVDEWSGDRDAWPDLYLTHAPDVEMALAGKKARSALYHNNHDGNFTEAGEKAGVSYPCWAMGASVGDYNNDAWPDLLVTCFGGVVLYRNNGDGTFTDVTRQAGLGGDLAWATGAAFGDYDNDGWVDLFVAHYIDFNLKDLPTFGSKPTCQYHGVDVQCGPRGLNGSQDTLYHNNGDGSFHEVSKQAGWSTLIGFSD
jgi:enediyne biosynthesis protein E4